MKNKKNKEILLNLEFYIKIEKNGYSLNSNLEVQEYLNNSFSKEDKKTLEKNMKNIADLIDIHINNDSNNDCSNCVHCVPIGEGSHICDEFPDAFVLEDYAPTEDFYYCKGKKFEEI